MRMCSGNGVHDEIDERATACFDQALSDAGLCADECPSWLAMTGRPLATFLLISTTSNPVVMLLFPAWTVLVSLVVVRAGRLGGPIQPQERPDA